jgi:hypothetical protein
MIPSVGSAHRPAAILAPVVATLLASIVIGCTGAAGGSPTVSLSPTEPGTRPSGPVSIPPSGSSEPGAVPDALVAKVVADAAALAGVDPAEVVVVSTEAVTWNDGSLGCPKPGVNYIQQIIQGYRVVVEAGGQRYDYRAGSSGEPKRCEGSMPVGGSG